MLETSNKFDEEKFTKEKNISFSGDPNAQFPSGIVEYSNKNYTSLMIEAEEPPPQKKHWKFEE